MALHNLIGKEGEQAARDYLVSKGFTVRETNWRIKRLEIDLIAEKDMVLHIIEVKTRDSADIEDFDPMDAVDNAKQRHLIAAANAYISYWNLDHEIVYDVMVIAADKQAGTFDIELYTDAFYPRLRTF